MLIITPLTVVMRVVYTPPSAADFAVLFNQHVRGGGIGDIKTVEPHYYQRGGSLFGILGNVFKRTIPFLRSFLLPEVGNFAQNLIGDVGRNVPIKDSLKRNLISSGKNVAQKIVRGGGKRRVNRKKTIKRKIKKKVVSDGKKCGYDASDIFNRSNMNF